MILDRSRSMRVFVLRNSMGLSQMLSEIGKFPVFTSLFFETNAEDLACFLLLFGFPQWLSSKESACNAGDTEGLGLIPE